jgi:hypothetical protein
LISGELKYVWARISMPGWPRWTEVLAGLRRDRRGRNMLIRRWSQGMIRLIFAT